MRQFLKTKSTLPKLTRSEVQVPEQSNIARVDNPIPQVKVSTKQKHFFNASCLNQSPKSPCP